MNPYAIEALAAARRREAIARADRDRHRRELLGHRPRPRRHVRRARSR